MIFAAQVAEVLPRRSAPILTGPDGPRRDPLLAKMLREARISAIGRRMNDMVDLWPGKAEEAGRDR